ncbi:MAG: hypothetical protein ACKVQK_26455 [Burkholderiales bacterium]
MKPRGERLACSLKSLDGCLGAFSVFPGEAPKSIAKIEDVVWNKDPQKDVSEGAFSVIGDMGMTGRVLIINTYQWRALKQAKIESHFYAAILWGLNPMKVVEDAQMMTKRGA